MHEHQGTDASQDIYSLVQLCHKTEQDSGLADNLLKELKRYLNEFNNVPLCFLQNFKLA
jgi:hypothetical protein